MIATLIIIAIAFYWLLRETDYLRVRLLVGKVNNKTLLLTAGKDKPVLLLDTIHYKPSQFTPLDIPELTGELNIICERR